MAWNYFCNKYFDYLILINFLRIFSDEQERQPLSSGSNGYKKGSVVESDGKVTLGDNLIIGKNSAVWIF